MAINTNPNLLADLEFPDQEPGHNLIHKTEKYKVVRVCVKSGLILPPHVEEHSAFFTVLQGKGVFIMDGVRTELSAGGYIFIPSGANRSIEGLEDLVLLAVKE